MTIQNKDMPAMPQSFSMTHDDWGTPSTHLENEEMYTGLTKHEQAVLMFIQGILSHPPVRTHMADEVASIAIAYADAAFAAMEKTK